MKQITIPTDHDFLTATEFTPENPSGKVVLINAATGIKQSFYYNYAAFLAERGYFAYTYDYSGIGLSQTVDVRKSTATYRTWGQIDYPAVVRFIRERHPDKPLYLIGHSVGGNCLGLSEISQELAGIVSICSQHGYWRYFNRSTQPQVFLLFNFSMPLVTRALGYFPSRVKALGESLPKGVALDWCHVITNKNGFMGLANDNLGFYHQIKNPMLVISVEDDWQAPRRAVDAFAQQHYPNARVTRKHFVPQDFGVSAIGHLDFFRKKFRDKLWLIPLDWIENGG
jgi:predicted alpha/beta hydrolase